MLLAFRSYVGLIDPKGDFHIALLADYSLIQFMLNGLIYPVKFLLEFLGYQTRYTSDSVGILHGHGVKIFFACLGVRIMIAYTALIFAFEGRKKFIFWISGLFMIYIFNILRMFCLVYFNNGERKILQLTHDGFNYAGYGIVIVFFTWWYLKYSKKESA
jgi:exosortase/archaeosortase family protein